MDAFDWFGLLMCLIWNESKEVENDEENEI